MPTGDEPADHEPHSGRGEPDEAGGRPDESENWGFDASDYWNVDEFEDDDPDDLEDWDPSEYENDEPDVPPVWVLREGKHVGVALRSGRRRLGWNQRELAKRAGLSQATIARMEAGADARLSAVVRALWVCGLELRAAPPVGAPADWRVVPHPMDEGRDSGGRRLPAHLAAYPATHLPTYTMWKRMLRGESTFAAHPPHWLYAYEPWPVPPATDDADPHP